MRKRVGKIPQTLGRGRRLAVAAIVSRQGATEMIRVRVEMDG